MLKKLILFAPAPCNRTGVVEEDERYVNEALKIETPKESENLPTPVDVVVCIELDGKVGGI